MIEAKYEVGQIVCLKSHPLLYDYKLNCLSSQCPPLMVVKDVLYEDDRKKKIFSDEVASIKIADLIKYTCIYFHNNKSEFVEVTIYESHLASYKCLKYNRELDSEGNETQSERKLIDEVALYTTPTYEFGKIVQFRTSKLEDRKSFAGYDNGPKASYSSPYFVISGFKREALTDMFYGDGSAKRRCSERLIKVAWFNHFQQKVSEQYLPIELFTDYYCADYESKIENTDSKIKVDVNLANDAFVKTR